MGIYVKALSQVIIWKIQYKGGVEWQIQHEMNHFTQDYCSYSTKPLREKLFAVRSLCEYICRKKRSRFHQKRQLVSRSP